MREPINYLQLGMNRIQAIYDGSIIYLEDDPAEILALSDLFIKGNKALDDDDLWDQIEYRLSNAPQPFFGDFKMDKNKNLYFRDYDEVIPGSIKKQVIEAKELNNHAYVASLSAYQSLSMLNVNKKARADLYDFMNFNGIKTTPMGYFVGYKAVRPVMPSISEEVQKQLELFKFNHYDEDFLVQNIDTERYGKLSNIRQRNEQLEVQYTDGDNTYFIVGKFKDLYAEWEDLKAGLFVDKHTGKVKQRIGDVLSMPRVECDPDSSVGCSVGFHVGSPEYVNNFASRGDKILHCLVNPADVVAVPKEDVSKLRTCQYYIAGYSDLNEDGTIAPLTDPYFESDYATIEREQIEDELRDKDFSKYIDSRIESTSVEEAQAIIEARLKLVGGK